MRYTQTCVAHVGSQGIIVDMGLLHALCQKTWASPEQMHGLASVECMVAWVFLVAFFGHKEVNFW